MSDSANKNEIDAARKVQKACIAAAIEAYEHASMAGLCHEGAFEAAIGAMQMLKLDEVVTGD